MPIEMRRFRPEGTIENPGLVFDRFLPEWQEDATARGEETSEFLTKVAKCSVPKIYHAAYARWQRNLLDTDQMALWCGRIQGRLFTGLGMPHPLETQVMRNRLYGVPLLPGSGLKGLARDWARKYSDLSDNAIAVLFGRAGDDDGGDAGYLIFHDAWWIPDSASTPLVKEVVTVHHGDYYGSEGDTPATDFDSPNPSFQLAVRGSFLFAIEGAKYWAELAMDILRKGLEEEGFGGKVAAGYGYFKDDSIKTRELNGQLDQMKEERVKEEIDKEIENETKGMSELEKEFYVAEKKGNWEQDKNSFLSDQQIENWLKRLEENADHQVIERLKNLLNIHFKGLLDNPDKTKGKRNKPVFSERMRKVAHRLMKLEKE